MPYVKDPDYYTRGVGAIQARDKISSRGRARAQLERARTSARIDRKRLQLMGMGDGMVLASGTAPLLLGASAAPSSSSKAPATLQTLNAMLNIANQKIYSKGAQPGPSLGANAPIDATTVAALNAILASGMSPLVFIDARITPAWIDANATSIVNGLQAWLGYGSGVVADPGFIVGTATPTSKFSHTLPVAPPPPTPSDMPSGGSGGSSTYPPPDVIASPPIYVTPPGYAPPTTPTSGQAVGYVRMWIASNPGVALGGAALAAYLLFFRKRG